MTNDGSKDYAFDADNRLTAQPSGAVTLAYDPTSRLSSVAQGGTTTRLLYDGADLIAEYDGAGALLRRYVHGPGVDDPIVWLEGTGTSDRRWLAADERGSVLAATNVSGALVGTLNRYDTYGIPAGGVVTGRFGYTGQMWIPELALYHYKARVYHPRFGRFLQTDPIRYGDGMHLYAYVGNDPLNGWDPTGTCTFDEAGNPKAGLCASPNDDASADLLGAHLEDQNSLASSVDADATTAGHLIWLTLDRNARTTDSGFTRPDDSLTGDLANGEVYLGTQPDTVTGTANGSTQEGPIPLGIDEAFEHELSHAVDFYDGVGGESGAGTITASGALVSIRIRGTMSDTSGNVLARGPVVDVGAIEARAVNRENAYRINSGIPYQRTRY